MRSYGVACAAAMVLVVGSAATADVVTLGASRDNTLFENANGAVSNGAGVNMFVGRNSQGGIRRGLVAFDLSAIPAGSTITSVSLMLLASQTQGPAGEVALYRTLADWGEGSSSSTGGGGAPSQPGDATWIHTSFNTSFWTTPGGDFAPEASASLLVSDPGAYVWSSTSELVADVQGWLDNPGSNFGWGLIGQESSTGTAKRFETRENEVEGSRPLLRVEYVVPAPSAAVLFGGAVLGAWRRPRRR